MRGVRDLPLVKIPHPVGSLPIDALKALARSTVETLTAGLIQGNCFNKGMTAVDSISGGMEDDLVALPQEPSAMFEAIMRRGWSDGLPVLPPTPTAVDAMLRTSRMQPDYVLGIVPPLNGIAAVKKIAANAVMAGCLPEYFPLVLAATKGMLQTTFNLDGVQTTTGNIAPVTLVNGPCRNKLDINCASNVLGQGWRANATIGRAVRFILTNIGGAVPGLYDKSTLGQPAKYTFCFGENEEQSPWEPLHIERGLSRDIDAVSMFGCSGVYSAVDMASQTARELLKTFALTMMGGLTSGVTSTEVMLIICPEHAAILSSGGYAKAEIRETLFSAARVPHEKISDDNLELLSKRRPAWFQQQNSSEIGVVDRPEDIWVVVAGGSGAKSAYLPGRTGTHLQTIAVE